MYGNDVYSSPEKHGLEVVGGLGEKDLCYEFNELVVWRKLDDGALYWAMDSGCSCPSPFEDLGDIDSLGPPLTKDSYDAFADEVNSFPAEGVDKTQLLAKVWSLLS